MPEYTITAPDSARFLCKGAVLPDPSDVRSLKQLWPPNGHYGVDEHRLSMHLCTHHSAGGAENVAR